MLRNFCTFNAARVSGHVRAREAFCGFIFCFYICGEIYNIIYKILIRRGGYEEKEKRKRRDYFSAHYGLTRGHNGLSVEQLEYFMEDDCYIPRLRTKRDKKNFKKAKKNVKANK